MISTTVLAIFAGAAMAKALDENADVQRESSGGSGKGGIRVPIPPKELL